MRKKHTVRRNKRMHHLNSMVSENVRLRNLLSEYLLEKEISLIENEDTGLSEQIEEYRERCSDLREQIMSLEVENESLKTELSRHSGQDLCEDDANPVMKTLYRENKELNRKVNEYRAEIDSMQLHLEELTNGNSREKKTGPPLFFKQACSAEHDSPSLSQDGSPENSENDLILPDCPSAGGNGTLYNVFLPKLTSDEKKDKAVHLISEISGISEEEAALLSNKVVIPVVRGVKKDKADSIKTRFIEAGILPRVKRQV